MNRSFRCVRYSVCHSAIAALVLIAGCGDASTSVRAKRESTSLHGDAIRFAANGKEFFLTTTVLRDASGIPVASIPDSLARRVEAHRAVEARVNALLAKLASDKGYQDRVRHFRVTKPSGDGRTPSGLLPLLSRQLLPSRGTISIPKRPSAMWYCDDYGNCEYIYDGGGADACTLMALQIYETTQTWEEDEAELNAAWVQLGLDGAAFARDVADGDVANAALDAAATLTDDANIAYWQIQADAVAADLEVDAAQYWAMGC